MSDTEEPGVPAHEGDGRLGDALVRRWTAIGTAVAVAVFWLVATLGRPWLLFADQGLTVSRFFDIQAQRLVHGHLSVPKGSLAIEEFVTPQGSHMYFGLFPAVIRTPLFLFGDALQGRLTLISCLVALVVTCLATARLARRAQRRLGLADGDGAASPRWFALIAPAPVLMTPLLHLASRSMVYHEAIAWGVAGALWGVDAAMQWWHLRRRRDAVVALLAAIVAINSRPSVGLIPVVMLLLLGAVAVLRRDRHRAALAGAMAIAAFAVYSAIDMARFRQWWGAPGRLQVAYGSIPEQQAAVALTDGSLFSLRFVPTTLRAYFTPWVGSVHLSRLFPFVEFGAPPKVVGSVPMSVSPTGTLPFGAPVVMVLAVVGLVWVIRRGDVAWRCAAIAGAFAALATLGFWAVFHRYLADFVPLAVLLAIPGLWTVVIAARRSSQRRRTAVVVLAGVVAAWAMLVQISLAIWAHTLAYIPDHDEQATMLRMRYSIDDAFFRGMPPDLFVVGTDGTKNPFIMPSPGRVLIAGECDVMYTGEFGWRTFEIRSGGAFRAVVAATPDELAALRDGVRTVASGDGWRLDADPGDSSRPPALRLWSGGEQVAEGPLSIDPSGVVLDVVADALVQIVSVQQDGAVSFSVAVPGLRGLRAADGWEVLPSDAPTCRALLERQRNDALRMLSGGG